MVVSQALVVVVVAAAVEGVEGKVDDVKEYVDDVEDSTDLDVLDDEVVGVQPLVLSVALRVLDGKEGWRRKRVERIEES